MIKKLGHILLALAVIGVSLLVLGSPSQANPAGPSNLSIDASAPPMTKPPILLNAKPAPTKLAKGSQHGVPLKVGSPSTMAAGTGFHYVYAQETPAAVQGYFQSNMWVSSPTLPAGAAPSHTLAELSMQYGNTAPGGYRDNIVEVGWAREPMAFPDDKARLFASAWWLNSGVSTWCGSYQGGCGYVDNPTNCVDLGVDLTLVPVTWTSCTPGGILTTRNDLNAVKKFVIQYQATGCGASAGIWVYYATDWVGCFPTTGGASRLSSSMTGGQFFQAFGEVHKNSSGQCIGMGNDLFPVTSTTATAYFNTLSHSATGGPANGNFTSVSATDPTIWGGLWLSNVAFRYGGKEVSPC